MASAIEVANMALSLVGDETIATFSDENKRARMVALHFDQARKSALRMAVWGCCTKRVSLPKDATAPAWGWENRFALPGDYIRLADILNTSKDCSYEIEDRFIVTNLEAPLKIRYVFDDQDVSGFDPLLTQVFVHNLAMMLVEPLSHSSTRYDRLEAALRMYLARASRVDGSEKPARDIKPSSWVTARR